MHVGAEKIGACILPVGPADSERQILLIKQFKTTVLYAATNYHLRLLEVAKSLSEDLSMNSIKRAGTDTIFTYYALQAAALLKLKN
jgi:phenylacetate-CoA ligase